jgi:hypothetical protein
MDKLSKENKLKLPQLRMAIYKNQIVIVCEVAWVARQGPRQVLVSMSTKLKGVALIF